NTDEPRYYYRIQLSVRIDFVHLRPQRIEQSEDGSSRNEYGRARNAGGHRRDAGSSRDHQLHDDRHRNGHRQPDRRGDVDLDADDRDASADRALTRFRSSGRVAGWNIGILSTRSARRGSDQLV